MFLCGALSIPHCTSGTGALHRLRLGIRQVRRRFYPAPSAIANQPLLINAKPHTDYVPRKNYCLGVGEEQTRVSL